MQCVTRNSLKELLGSLSENAMDKYYAVLMSLDGDREVDKERRKK